MENNFARFVKERFGVFLTVISSMPLLANYFEIFLLDKKVQKSTVLITTLFCGLVFFVLQSKRYAIAGRHQRNWLIVGFAAALIGTILFFIQLSYEDQLKSEFIGQSVIFFCTFFFLLNGAAILLLQIFVNEEERKQIIFEVVAVLNHDQWLKFIPFCKAFLGISEKKTEQIPSQQRAFKKSRDHIVSLTADMFSKINQGTFEIRGAEMDRIYKYYMQAVRKEFCATSYNDLSYWKNEDESTDYFNSNVDIIKRGCTVERIFIVENKGQLMDAREVVCRQISAGIKVRILLISEELNRMYSKVDLDFGLFDDFAVSSWNFIRGRVFKMSESTEEYVKFKSIYSDLKSRCEKLESGKRVFESKEEFTGWLSK